MIKALVIFGTRPEAIKMAPVVAELRRRPAFRTAVCVTAQHRQMLDQVLRPFGIQPEHDLDLMRPGQSLEELTGRVVTAVAPIIDRERPDVVLVQGDTTTSTFAALAAFYRRVPVGHVEAGLRTDDRYHPFPEEINRRMTTAIAQYHFAPTERARENLRAAGVPDADITVTGNTVIDALLYVRGRPFEASGPPWDALDARRRLVLVTTHRRESFGPPMREIARAVRTLVERHADLEVVLPVHPNPQVRETVTAVLDGVARVHLVPPMDYEPWVHLMDRAELILTDSGGIQEEAPSLGTPVLVMRETTERPEAVEAGAARLVGANHHRIVTEADRLLTDRAWYDRMAHVRNPFGDGHAAERIVGVLASRLAGSPDALPPPQAAGLAFSDR
jgi:UDP-N-acetylglucosamine 2-epimerase